MLKDPQDYISTVTGVLSEAEPTVVVESTVDFGHKLSRVKSLVEEKGVDLLVLETKDEDQLAMHGLAYPIAVELRSVPLLMI